MRRRTLIIASGIANAAVLLPLTTRAQHAGIPTIGGLAVASPDTQRFWRDLRAELGKLGYEDGKTVRYDIRSDEGDLARLDALARGLVRSKVAVIVAWFTPAVLAAKRATHNIPIVMGAAGDPVAIGLIDSLAHPGGNVTGIGGLVPDLAGKCVDLSRDLVPKAKRIAALVNVPDPFSRPFLDKIRAEAATIGLVVEPVRIKQAGELEAAFSALAKDPPATVIVQPSLPARRVAELAIQHRIAAVGLARALVDAGGLMSYSSDDSDLPQQVADFIDRILKGARPADLPVEQPTHFELAINLKTAQAIGLSIPSPLFQRADTVIE
jgi:putative ABC transport system substrate-binding protein